jgi:hypothetical protein
MGIFRTAVNPSLEAAGKTFPVFHAPENAHPIRLPTVRPFINNSCWPATQGFAAAGFAVAGVEAARISSARAA